MPGHDSCLVSIDSNQRDSKKLEVDELFGQLAEFPGRAWQALPLLGGAGHGRQGDGE